jgi:hypothetical protein
MGAIMMKQFAQYIVLMAVGPLLLETSFAAQQSSQNKEITVARGGEIVESKSGSLDLSIELQCGEAFTGLLVRESKDDIEVSAIIKRPTVLCMGAPVEKEIPLQLLSLSSFKEISSLDEELGDQKIVMQELKDLQQGRDGLRAQIWSDCREFLGVAVYPRSTNGGHLAEVAAAWSADSAQDGKECKPGNRVILTRSLSLGDLKLAARSRPGQIENLFTYQVVPANSLKSQLNGALEIYYRGRCHEMPVGVVMTQDQKVAVLLAQFINGRCNQEKLAEKVFVLGAGNLQVDSKQLALMTAADISGRGYARVSPSQVLPLTATIAKGGQLIAPAVPRYSAIVVSTDLDGHVATAALVGFHRADGRNVNVPVRVKSGDMAVYPLRIKGTPIVL